MRINYQNEKGISTFRINKFGKNYYINEVNSDLTVGPDFMYLAIGIILIISSILSSIISFKIYKINIITFLEGITCLIFCYLNASLNILKHWFINSFLLIPIVIITIFDILF